MDVESPAVAQPGDDRWWVVRRDRQHVWIRLEVPGENRRHGVDRSVGHRGGVPEPCRPPGEPGELGPLLRSMRPRASSIDAVESLSSTTMTTGTVLALPAPSSSWGHAMAATGENARNQIGRMSAAGERTISIAGTNRVYTSPAAAAAPAARANS